jgi:hypothetical protein
VQLLFAICFAISGVTVAGEKRNSVSQVKRLEEGRPDSNDNLRSSQKNREDFDLPIAVSQENYSAIPWEMFPYNQWVGFDAKKRPRDGEYRIGSPTDPSTWFSFKHLKDLLNNTFTPKAISGFGFALTKNDPFFVVDLDDCRNPGTGEIEEWAEELIEEFGSLTEISFSGKGIHIFAKGVIDEGFGGFYDYYHGGDRYKIEVYDRERYIAMTCRWLKSGGASDRIQRCQKEINSIIFNQKRSEKSRTQKVKGDRKKITLPCYDGQRNDTMFRIALRAVTTGANPEEILSELREINSEQFYPPLEDKELCSCFRSAQRFADRHGLDFSEVEEKKGGELVTNKAFEKFRKEYTQKGGDNKAPDGRLFRQYFYEDIVRRFGRLRKDKPCAPCTYCRDGNKVVAKLLYCHSWSCSRCAPYRKEIYVLYLLEKIAGVENLYLQWISDEEWDQLESSRRNLRRLGHQYAAFRTNWEDAYEVISTKPLSTRALKVGFREIAADKREEIVVDIIRRLRKPLFKRERLIKTTEEWSVKAAMDSHKDLDVKSGAKKKKEFLGIGPTPAKAAEMLRPLGYFVQLLEPDYLSGVTGKSGRTEEETQLFWGAEILVRSPEDLDTVLLVLGIRKPGTEPMTGFRRSVALKIGTAS